MLTHAFDIFWFEMPFGSKRVVCNTWIDIRTLQMDGQKMPNTKHKTQPQSVEGVLYQYSSADASDVVPRDTASPRGSLEAQFSLPRSRPRSRLSCLGLVTASRHQSQRSQFFSHNILRKLKQDLNVHKICKIYLILGHLPALH